MTEANWGRLKRVFQGALEQPAATRDEWVAQACEGDSALEQEVRRLLAVSETSGGFLEQPATVDPADVTSWPPGTMLGTYRVVEELGRGGMGIVYLAEDTRLHRKVALKALAAPVFGDSELGERLAREARAAATISHPAVATVYALEELDGRLVIVSEYVPGHTLRAAVAQGALDPARARRLAIQIAGALVAAHEAGVVHRDLKPENVLLTANGDAKVVDFGIAHVESLIGARLTRSGVLLGTPAYMAPEQLVGRTVDPRADIYAFGVLLSELVTGRHPLDTTGGGPSVPAGPFATVRARCMQTDPDARYGSARELLAVLEHIDAGDTPGEDQSHARWWWGFHQGASAVVYALMTIPAWQARGLLGGVMGRAFFVLVLTSAIVAAALRLHWWFTGRSYPAHLPWVQARTSAALHAAEWTFAGSLSLAGIALFDTRAPLAALLLAVGIGAAVAFAVIEPGTARAAHGGTGTTSQV